MCHYSAIDCITVKIQTNCKYYKTKKPRSYTLFFERTRLNDQNNNDFSIFEWVVSNKSPLIEVKATFRISIKQSALFGNYTTQQKNLTMDASRVLFVGCLIDSNFFFTLSNAKHGRKYWNRSRGKLAFKGLSGKDYGTHGLN